MSSLWLTLLVFSPLAGMLLVAIIPRDKREALRTSGTVLSLLPLVILLWMSAEFLPGSPGFQWVQQLPWFTLPFPTGGSFTFEYTLGADGLSLALLYLAAVVTPMAALAGFSIQQGTKNFYLLLLFLEMALLGTFAAQNLFLFFLFFEGVILAIWLLAGRYGGVERERAANSFLLYNGIGSGLLLVAIVLIMVIFQTLDYAELSGILTDPESAAAHGITEAYRWAILLLILAAFAVKLPVFPLHTWMLRINREVHPAVVMLESGLVLKIGAYGLLRFGAGLFPDLMQQLAVWLAVLGLINLLGGALMAFVSRDLQSIWAYSSLSHMGVVLLGIAAMNEAGMQGAMFQTVSHGLLAPVLFYLLLLISQRTGTTSLEELGGMARKAPVLSGLFMVAAMGTLGLPFLSGFVSEFFVFTGLFDSMPAAAAIGVPGMILTAAYMLRALLGVTYGPVREAVDKPYGDVGLVEGIPLVVLLALVLLVGTWPSVLAGPLQGTIQSIIAGIGG